MQENRFDTIYTDYVDCNSLTISLLNTRSLKRHAADISRARRLTENDILCLTESQITNDTDVAEIKEQLSTFEIYFNSCGVRHENLAFCLGQNIVLLCKRNLIHFSYFPFWLSIAPLMKPISLKYIGHGSCDNGFGRRKLRLVHDLSVNTPCNFFPTKHPFLWKGYCSSTYFPRCLLFERHI